MVETLGHNADKSSLTPNCTCSYYNHYTMKTDHFATFPPALVETPILAGCPLYICSKCGKPREKIYEHKNMVIERSNHAEESGIRIMSSGTMVAPCEDKFIGYSDCGCGEYTCNKCGTEMVFKHSEFIPGTVMDIFAGSGTTLQCALALGRKSIGIEQSEEYCKLATKRKMQVGF
uniref:Putative methyltransferase n=1 Tax=viral metagenome TaxID=1070528 RepID=A0A6M3LN58_9ZZZZ